jgi:uncharacterized membrane protein YvbJ
MNCPSCGNKNPATVSYCQRCGSRMDLTADEIQASLVEKAKGEIIQSTEFYARQSLMFAVVLLLFALTMLVLASGAPKETYYVPSMSREVKYLQVTNPINIDVQKLVVPLEPRRRGR